MDTCSWFCKKTRILFLHFPPFFCYFFFSCHLQLRVLMQATIFPPLFVAFSHFLQQVFSLFLWVFYVASFFFCVVSYILLGVVTSKTFKSCQKIQPSWWCAVKLWPASHQTIEIWEESPLRWNLRLLARPKNWEDTDINAEKEGTCVVNVTGSVPNVTAILAVIFCTRDTILESPVLEVANN